MKNLLALACSAVLAAGISASADTPIVQNGDFSVDDTSFAFPGYSSTTNPIPYFATNANSPTVTDTGTPGVNYSADAPFAPDNYKNQSYGFLQRTSSISQSINLLVGGTYKLSFDSADRAGYPDPTDAGITISSGLLSYTYQANKTSGSGFLTTTEIFTAGAKNSTLTLFNNAASGDETEDFTNITITELTAPEPSTYGLLGLGVLALILIGRRSGLKI